MNEQLRYNQVEFNYFRYIYKKKGDLVQIFKMKSTIILNS